MKKIVFILSVLLNIGLIYFFVFKGSTVSSTDSRVAMKLSKNNRDFVLAEMRGFLESVQLINNGIVNNDVSKVIEGGKKSGGSVIAHAPQGMMASLPMGFKKIGFATHDLFDEFSKTTKENFDVANTQKRLDVLLNKCIACHRTYKIEITE